MDLRLPLSESTPFQGVAVEFSESRGWSFAVAIGVACIVVVLNPVIVILRSRAEQFIEAVRSGCSSFLSVD